MLAVCLVLYIRNTQKKQKCLCDKLQQFQDKIDVLYLENLFLKFQGKEYTLASDYEVKLLGTPPIFEFIKKKYRPVVRFDGSFDDIKLTLVGADVYEEDYIGDDDARLVVERCVNRISAEVFDDFLIQLREGFVD